VQLFVSLVGLCLFFEKERSLCQEAIFVFEGMFRLAALFGLALTASAQSESPSIATMTVAPTAAPTLAVASPTHEPDLPDDMDNFTMTNTTRYSAATSYGELSLFAVVAVAVVSKVPFLLFLVFVIHCCWSHVCFFFRL